MGDRYCRRSTSPPPRSSGSARERRSRSSGHSSRRRHPSLPPPHRCEPRLHHRGGRPTAGASAQTPARTLRAAEPTALRHHHQRRPRTRVAGLYGHASRPQRRHTIGQRRVPTRWRLGQRDRPAALAARRSDRRRGEHHGHRSDLPAGAVRHCSGGCCCRCRTRAREPAKVRQHMPGRRFRWRPDCPLLRASPS